MSKVVQRARAGLARGASTLGVLGAAPTVAQARLTLFPNRDATALGRALADNPRVVRRAVFSIVPPGGYPAVVSTTRLAGFPVAGDSFTILTTGDARFAPRPNSAPDTGRVGGGPFVRGARDVTILRVYLSVPRKANCLSIRFRFLSEEFPEFVGSDFNDAFIAELDGSTWTAGTNQDPRINAPRNFAVDAKGNAIRVNRVGLTSVTPARARGTTYDAATRRLRASTRITPGRHSLYLSIFDQGDRQYDSAVFLDRLTLDRRAQCRSGVASEGS